MLHANHVRGRNCHFGIDVSVLLHPAVVINLAEIAGAGVGKKYDDEIAFLAIFRYAQGAGNAAAARAARENPFLLGEAACPDETFFVIHLDNIVDDFQIHGAGEKIFANSFHNVGGGLAYFARLHEIVVERAYRIDADDFDVRIFFFQVAADAADRAPRSHAANEVGDFAFGIVPDLRAGGFVVGLRIHRIFVLIRIVRVGNFSREFFGDRIVAARVFRFGRGRADDHFGAESLQQIDFLARLLVVDGEYDFVASRDSDESKSHARIAGGAFANC